MCVPLKIDKAELTVLKRSEEQIHTVYDIPKTMEAPVKAGQEVGKVTYYLGERKIGEFPVKADGNVEKLEFPWYVNYLLERFWMQKKLCMNFWD